MVSLKAPHDIARAAIPGIALILALLSGGPSAAAGEFPSKPLSIIVPFAAGGGTDVQARVLAKGLAARLGQPVVVDNRPGAGGRIGAALAARAAADGHTLFIGSLTTLVIEPVLRPDVGYDPQHDFATVTLVTEEPFLLVVPPSLPVKTMAELLAYAEHHQLTYGSFGAGSSAHLLGEMFKTATHASIAHVPYKGAAPAITDLMGGHISMMFANAITATPYIRSGTLRALAVTGPSRLAILPQVPTLAESSVTGVDLRLWYGLVLPAKTPSSVVARLNKELTEVIKGGEFRTFVENLGGAVIPGSPKDMSQRIQSDTEAIRSLVKRINFRVED